MKRILASRVCAPPLVWLARENRRIFCDFEQIRNSQRGRSRDSFISLNPNLLIKTRVLIIRKPVSLFHELRGLISVKVGNLDFAALVVRYVESGNWLLTEVVIQIGEYLRGKGGNC